MLSMYKTARNGLLILLTVHDRQRSLLAPFALSSSRSVGSVDGKERLELFDSEEEMDRWVASFIHAKERLGYKILYQYDRREAYCRPSSLSVSEAEAS